MTIERWEQLTDVPQMFGGIAFLVAWSVPLAVQGLPSWAVITCGAIVAITWLMIAADVGVCLFLSVDKVAYLKKNWFDVVVVILPFFRPLQLLRLVSMMSMLNKKAAARLRGNVVSYVVFGSLLLIWCGGLVVYDIEHTAEGATILSMGDGLWWAMVTVTTVGYGDLSPVTGMGRIVAAALMVCGIALLGAVTASLASWMVDTVEESTTTKVATHSETKLVLAELAALRAEIAQLREATRKTPTLRETGSQSGPVSTTKHQDKP